MISVLLISSNNVNNNFCYYHVLLFMSFNANILCRYILKYFNVFVKLQGPVLEQLWLNRATLGKYVVNKITEIK